MTKGLLEGLLESSEAVMSRKQARILLVAERKLTRVRSDAGGERVMGFGKPGIQHVQDAF